MKVLKVNPMVLLLLNLLVPTMYIFIHGAYLQMFFMVFCSVLLLVTGNIKSLVVSLVFYGGIYEICYVGMQIALLRGIVGFFVILIQFIPCLMLASILVTKYSSTQLLSALEAFHLPRVLVIATTITLKFFPTFRREFSYIRESMRLRGIAFSWKRPVESFRYFIAPQLFRCAALAEEVTAAGLVKGMDMPVKRTSYFEVKLRYTDALVLIVFVAGIAGGFVWNAS
ncbi:MAG: energy-coupling factor transporter transmembrane protein EcfT [Lachnospiraceae bacterium]|nr:energy-coupling factor transporter transmembrane protein EcfT [Lachnospiraceae bacterium]